MKTVAETFDDHWTEDTETGCWVWQRSCSTGQGRRRYGKLRVNGRTVSAHRYSFERRYGKIPTNNVVMHTCDNEQCVNPEHLQIGTHSLNRKDCVDKGRAHFNEKISAKIAEQIRKAYIGTHRTQIEVAQMFGVSQTQVSKICLRQCWGGGHPC